MLTVLVLKLTWESISLLCVHNQDQLFQSNMEPPYMGIACGNLLLLYIIYIYLLSVTKKVIQAMPSTRRVITTSKLIFNIALE